MTAFSDTTNNNGLIELLGRDTNTQSTTSSSYSLAVKTSDINEALGNYFLLAIKAGGRFQVDDTNQSDMPVITTDIVSGRADYTFISDTSSPANQILDIRKVRMKDSSGTWTNLTQIDRETFNINSYQGVTGTPIYFDLSGDSIVLYPTPSYALTNGLEMYISRTPVYFLSSDTTKEAGIPKLFQSYLHLRPAYIYSMIKNLPQAVGLQIEVANLEKAIKDYYSRRNRTERPRLTVNSGGVDSNK